MTLTLRAVSLNDVPLREPIAASFDRRGGTIGRADNNTMALPDPERHISRQQAEIIASRTGYSIRNVGSANPIVVRDKCLLEGDSAPLVHGDRVRIAGYLLEVVDAGIGSEAPTVICSQATSAALQAAPAAEPMGLFGATVSAPEPPASDDVDWWSAFCEGAGVRLPASAATAQTMHTLGLLLRAAVEGTVQLMAVRSATRHELHADQTLIQPRDNNPLKFSPDAQCALEQLLAPTLRGFLPGPAAMREAMNDLVGHAIGTMAGTRAAFEGMLERFGPGQLEARLIGRSVLDRLPMRRKARLWDLYLQHYDGIRDEAQDDFHALFGKAFLAAYEQQLERLRRDREPPAAPHVVNRP
jgi:predicted component of type VI protein secretion system